MVSKRKKCILRDWCQTQIPENNQNSQERKSAIVYIKVFDTFSGSMIQNLDKTCRLEKEIQNYSSVFKAHPKNEHQFLSFCDGGITVFYDVKRLEVVQENPRIRNLLHRVLLHQQLSRCRFLSGWPILCSLFHLWDHHNLQNLARGPCSL